MSTLEPSMEKEEDIRCPQWKLLLFKRLRVFMFTLTVLNKLNYNITGIDLVVPPPKQISFSRVSSRDVSKTNSSKQGSAEGWKVLRDSVAFWILKKGEKGPMH